MGQLRPWPRCGRGRSTSPASLLAVRTEARFPSVPEKAGHYESFYLKLTRPEGSLGAWIRHTVHKRPKEPFTCALWFTLFDSEAPGPRATKRQFGAARLQAPADSYIR